MPVTITEAAILVPTVAAQAIFSGRRAKNGVDNLEENPIFGIMNLDIAAAQLLKGIMAVKAISMINNGVTKEFNKSSIESGSKFLKFGKGALNFTAKYINHVIWAAGAAKVLFGNDEDKWSAAGREACSIGTMRLSEEAYKAITNMPNIIGKSADQYENNKIHQYLKENIFKDSRIAANKDVTAVKKLIAKVPKSIRGGAKGVGFVLASIGGYALGAKIGKGIFGSSQELCPQEVSAS